MALTLDAQIKLGGGGSITEDTTGTIQTAGFGAGVLPKIEYVYSYGTGAGQADAWYLARRTLAATTFDNINMTTGLLAVGTTFSLTRLKRVLVAIISPDGTKSLRIGPQNQTNANALWFADTAADKYETTFTYILHDRPITGWTVTAGATDILSIYNPGATSVTYAIWVLGLD